VADVGIQQIHVRRSLSRVKDGYRVGTPRNGKGRSVPLPPWLAEELAAYLDTIHANPESDAPLFPGLLQHVGLRRWKAGATLPATRLDCSIPWDRDAFYRSVFRPALIAAGLDSTTRLHDLRRSDISVAGSQGIPAYRVAAYAGHSDPGFTLRVYTHAFGIDAADDMAKLARPKAVRMATNMTPMGERRTS
jgi:integrase